MIAKRISCFGSGWIICIHSCTGIIVLETEELCASEKATVHTTNMAVIACI